MNLYVGTKAILARPMTRAAYNEYRGWELPSDENGDDEGMLVEYVDGGASNHPDHAGYVSWSPLDVFERAYRASGQLSFGHALEALKTGHRVARTGWNGKGMYLVLQSGGSTSHPLIEGGDEVEALPCISMWTVNAHGRRACLHGWLASQTDMLSDDWCIVEEVAHG